jgi:hypothetical protein
MVKELFCQRFAPDLSPRIWLATGRVRPIGGRFACEIRPIAAGTAAFAGA